MLKVIIVDDEAIVRLTLQTILDWEQNGFQIVGAYANGKQALRYIQEHQQVDLVITDINMPIMNGLELIEVIKEMGIATEILVISAYDDYELVRKAFKLGVSDYILKPEINHDSMQLLLSTIERRFKKNNNHHGLETNTDSGEQRLSAFLFEEEDVTSKSGEQEQVVLENYVVCLIMVEDYMRIVERFGQNLQGSLVLPFEETVKQVLLEMKNYFLLSRGPDEYVLIFNDLTKEQINEYLEPLLNRIRLQLKSFLNISVTMTISPFGEKQEDLRSLFNEVNAYMSLRFPFGKGAILFSSVMKSLKTMVDEHYFIYNKKLLGLMLDGNRLGVDTILEDISRQAKDYMVHTQDIKNVANFYLIVICEVGRYLSDIQDDLLNVFRKDMNYYERLLRFEQVKEMDIFMKNWVYWLMDYMSHQSNRVGSNVIEKAKKYIFNNYKNPDFSIKELSQFLDFSEKHFSAMFAKEVGETFTDYLTRMRINQAKELMITTNMKMYEICAGIGYNNVEHFSRVFKKATGFSPREYRNG